MKFYIVTDNYISHLKSVDSKVPNNYSAKKPYIGIVLEFDNIKYLAPLTSYKSAQDKLKSSNPTLFKMHEDGVPENKLGMVQLNNMIPVLDSEITLLDITAYEEKYQGLLNKQLVYLKKNKELIQNTASKLHKLVVVNKHPFFTKISCDFDALEKCMATFK